jgi:hypothetical protein
MRWSRPWTITGRTLVANRLLACSACGKQQRGRPLNAVVRRQQMPGLAVTVNGRKVATVSTEGYNLLSVRVAGDLISDEFASLDVSGGLYGEGDKSQHLTWVNLAPLNAGDEIEVTFLREATTSHPGKTLDELFPETERPMGPWEPLEKIFEDLAKQQHVRERFEFVITPSDGEPIRATTLPADHSFGFSVSWAWTSPELTRVSLSSASLEQIAKRVNGADHARFKLQMGQGVKLRVDV